MATPGYYKLTHVPTGLFYVGSSSRVHNRLSTHRSHLKSNTHSNKRFNQAFTTWDDIRVELYETATMAEAKDGEQRLLDKSLGDPKCCNVGTSSTNPLLGVVSPERSLANLYRNVRLGQHHTEEAKQKISQAKAGQLHREDSKEAISLSKSQPVMIEGVRYPSARLAAEAHGITWKAVTWRIKSMSERWKNWNYSS